MVKIASKDFFQWLCGLNFEQCACICNILQKNFIWQKSTQFVTKEKNKGNNPLNGIVLSEVLNYPDQLKNWFEGKDTVYIYSALQYLEGIFLVQTLLQQELDKKNIVFLLPSDEYTYFQDQKLLDTCKSFQNDLNILIPIHESPTVWFYNFDYKNNGCMRPYLKLKDDIVLLEAKNTEK